MQQQFSECFSSEQTQGEIESLRLHHQRRIEAANHLLQKREVERNQLIQQLNQRNTEVH